MNSGNPIHCMPKIGMLLANFVLQYYKLNNLSLIIELQNLYSSLTIRLDSEFEVVFAEPRERRTVNAAAKCLNASVSGPPPATSKSCRSSNIEAYVFPDPLVPKNRVDISVLQCLDY